LVDPGGSRDGLNGDTGSGRGASRTMRRAALSEGAFVIMIAPVSGSRSE
jgi:hypothetical protein